MIQRYQALSDPAEPNVPSTVLASLNLCETGVNDKDRICFYERHVFMENYGDLSIKRAVGVIGIQKALRVFSLI